MRLRGGAALVVIFALVSMSALAQTHPFAIGATESGGSATGITGWLMAEQATFVRLITNAVRTVKTEPSALWALMGLSFGYGVFHAAGPGHGKAVIASWMLANEDALKRGLVLTAFAALLQALVAIAIVAAGALVFRATARSMTDAALLIEKASFAAIAALGLWLVWTKGRAFWRVASAAWQPAPMLEAAFAGAHIPDASLHRNNAAACIATAPGHVHDDACGHNHGPDPATLGQNFSWRQSLSAIFAIGARPCSGAILVLVFALAQGAFWAGIAATLAMAVGTALTTGALASLAVFAKSIALRLTATDAGRAQIVLRGAEFAAALAVLGLGLALLAGLNSIAG